jgi:hypothetical protein
VVSVSGEGAVGKLALVGVADKEWEQGRKVEGDEVKVGERLGNYACGEARRRREGEDWGQRNGGRMIRRPPPAHSHEGGGRGAAWG